MFNYFFLFQYSKIIYFFNNLNFTNFLCLVVYNIFLTISILQKFKIFKLFAFLNNF